MKTDGTAAARESTDCEDWANNASDYAGVGSALALVRIGAPEPVAAVAAVKIAHESTPYLDQVCQWAQEHYGGPQSQAEIAGAFNCAKLGDCQPDDHGAGYGDQHHSPNTSGGSDSSTTTLSGSGNVSHDSGAAHSGSSSGHDAGAAASLAQ